MNILMITLYWINSPGGGIKTYLINLVDELKKNNFEVSVAFAEGDDPENYKIGKNKLLLIIQSILVSKKIKPNLILSQETWYCLLAGFISSKLNGSKLIHTFHTEPSNKRRLIGKLLMQFLLNRCDYVIFVSQGLENKINETLNFKSKRAVIYAGVNHKEVLGDDVIKFNEKFNLKNDQIILLGQALTAHKYKAEGAKILIKAVQILKNKYPRIVLLLTREGKYSTELKQFVMKENVHDVIFTGDIENPYIPLKICNIYTHISLREGLPIALLEAMSMGKPIVATPVGGIPEAIENNINGLLSDPDPKILAEKIEKLITNKEFARKLGERAKNTSEERFTWKISVDSLLKLVYNK